LLWPLLCIQGIISTHIILDGLNIFSKSGKFNNPPRQPLIGHILRNIEGKSEVEILKKVIKILTYKDVEAEEIGTGEESEYQKLDIKGLLNPEYLQTILKIIPYLDYLPITEYSPLDTSITTEEALDITEKYRNTIDTMKGNAFRWETQISLIDKEIKKWMTELTVKIKDIELLYSSQMNKTSSTIEDSQVKSLIELEQDKIDQWKVNEKRNLIENCTVLFKTAERNLQEIVKKNRFFSQEDSLKSKVFEDLVQPFENHFKFLKEESKTFINNIENLQYKFNELKEHASRIDTEAEKKLMEFKGNLDKKLQDRDAQLGLFKEEKEQKLTKLKTLQNEIESLNNKIKQIIQSKINECFQDANELIDWSIKDTQDELFSKPIQWIYMPLYAMFVEDEDSMEEQMRLVLPGYVNDIASLYEDLSDSFVELKTFLNEKIEDDMRIRSNFEFSVEKNNLIKNPNFQKRIEMGISILRNKGLMNDQIEASIKEKLNLIS
jgi:DNA repair exonuclease SbcCD ATPase subunit